MSRLIDIIPQHWFEAMRRRGFLLLSLVFALFVVLVIRQLTVFQNRIVSDAARTQAEQYVNALMETRRLYSDEVAEPLRAHGVDVTADFADRTDAIPLPASFSILLGERLSDANENVEVTLYSAFPYPERDIRELTDFEQNALTAISAEPQPYFEFLIIDGKRMIRYAVPDTMQESCVACHNTHPDSPKTDWQVGDVRGVLAVTLPVSSAWTQAQAGTRDIAIIVLSMVSVVGGMLYYLSRRTRRMTDTLESRVFERTAALTAANVRLERGIAERESAENRLGAVLDTVGEGIITISGEGKIVMVNREANAIWGFHPGELNGTHVDSLVTERIGALDSFEPDISAESTGHGNERTNNLLSRRFQMTGIRSDGSHFPVEIRITRTSFEDQRLFTIAARDITSRLGMENALREERRNLAQKVDARTAELSQANHELERASRMKDEFLASMSHELRTPLNAILGLSEALLTETYGDIGDRQLRPLHLIGESGRHLLELINDILDVSKIEAGRLTLIKSVVSVESLCQASLSFVREAARKKEIRLKFELDERARLIEVDERRMKQILVNLLSNAVKFTPERGSVGLQIKADPLSKKLHFMVIDTGIGIDRADYERLFQPFVQLDSKLSRAYSGTGLGLALVHRLTEMHNGAVSVESRPGKGSRFVVTIPWEPQDFEAMGEVMRHELVESAETQTIRKTPRIKSAINGANGHKPLILVAEDNEVNIATLNDFLQFKGYRVIVAQDGMKAVQLAEQNPDLILMDIQMPRMDGLEATRRIRANYNTAYIPIIALTGLAMSGDRERCLAAGADDYLSKPFQLDELVAIMETQLAGRPHMQPEPV